MRERAVVELRDLIIDITSDSRPGLRVLAGLVALAENSLSHLHRLEGLGRTRSPIAVLGRVRGTGRAASLSRLLNELEQAYPLRLQAPFEGSHLVSGAVWNGAELLDGGAATSVAKLCWEQGAVDLPMHAHEYADRMIVVAHGRGFFHVTDEPIERFTGKRVRSIPARERDVFLFTRGVVHTFSTLDQPMVLLSCQHPFLAFDDARQFTLPGVRWTAGDQPDGYEAVVGCDPAWTVLA